MINKYPYTDFHELNLDWFLAEFKKVMDRLLDLENAFATLKEYIDEYFRNLDLQEEVNNYFNSLIESGEFYNLLNLYFGNGLVDESLYSMYAQVIPDRNNRYDINISSQGFCIGENNGRKVAMNCFINGSDDSNIVVWTYMDTGVVLNTISISAGHSNSCTYNPDNGHYYIACGAVGSPRSTLIELDTAGNIYQESLIGSWRVWGVAYNKGKLYALFNDGALGIINPDDWTDYTVITGMDRSGPFTYQGLFADDNYLYLPNGNKIANVPQNEANINRISVYTHNGMLIKNIDVLFPLEVEEGDIYDGELYLSSNTGHAAMLVKADLYSINKQNALGFVNDNIEVNTVANTIYVDETYTDFEMDGTVSKPISLLPWIIVYLRNSITRLNVEILNDVSSTSVLSIRRFPSIILTIAGNNHLIPAIKTNCKELYLNSAIIAGVDNDYSIEYHGARLVLNNITFGTSGSTVVPDRLVFCTSNYEIEGVTINQDANFSFYMIGDGYLRAVTINTANTYKVRFGNVNCDKTFPLSSFRIGSNIQYEAIPVILSDYQLTIDMHTIIFPCIIANAGGTRSNLPAGVTGTNLLYSETVIYRVSNTQVWAHVKYFLNDNTVVYDNYIV